MTGPVVKLPLDPLDRPITFTHFLDLAATRRWAKGLRQFREIAGVVEQTVGRTKSALPLLSFCQFGKLKTKTGCLRHDANVTGFNAVVGDHDAGTQAMEDAAGLLREAGVPAFFYTTPSDEPGKPRWRIICPTAGELPPERYKALVTRLNRILGGTLTSESFTLSQSYYYGHVQGKEYTALFVRGAHTIDEVEPEDDWTDDVTKPREPLSARSGAAAALAYRMIDDDKTEDDWIEALDDGRSETAGWVDDSRHKHPNNNPDYELHRTWNNAKKLWNKRHPDAGTPLAYFDGDTAEVESGEDYLIDGVLDLKSLAVIYGDSTVGKTFFCLYLAYCIATGTPFFGRKTRKGAVLYVAAESGDRIKNRVVAMRDIFPLGSIPIRIITSKINLYADTVDLKRIIDAAKAAERDFNMPVVAIIIDTLARATPGMNENASEDMGLAVGRLDKLREETGVAVPLVHHSGKDQSKGARGWSGLRAAVDHEIEITRDKDVRFADLGSKQRDSDDMGKVVSFTLRVVELGERGDGEPITTCVIEELNDDVPRPNKSASKLPRQKRAVLDILDGLLAHGSVTMDEFREACAQSSKVCNSQNRKTRWSAFDRAFEFLAQEKLVFERNGMIEREPDPFA